MDRGVIFGLAAIVGIFIWSNYKKGAATTNKTVIPIIKASEKVPGAVVTYTTNGKLIIPASSTPREAALIEQIAQTIGTSNTYADIVRAAVGPAWDWGSEVSNEVRVTAMRNYWVAQFPGEPVPVSLRPEYEPAVLAAAAATGLSTLKVQALALQGDPGLLSKISSAQAAALGAPPASIPAGGIPIDTSGGTQVIPGDIGYVPPAGIAPIVDPTTGIQYYPDPSTGELIIVTPPGWQPAPTPVPIPVPGGGYIDPSTGVYWPY